MAIFSVIDCSATGDDFDEGMIKDAANWLIAETAMSGATTTIMVGGGVGSPPVLTTATGSGAPVRATAPSITSPVLTTPGILGSSTGKSILTSAIADAGDHTVTIPASTGTIILQGDAIAAPGAIGETTPNTIRGTNIEIFKTASADSPLTAAQCSGTIVSNFGMTDADCIIALPTAAAGLSFLLILPAVRARYFKLQAGTTDKIYLLGAPGSDNAYVGVASGYSAGSSCSFFTFTTGASAYDWFAIPIFGTWVAS
jgi:hypothetical protein